MVGGHSYCRTRRFILAFVCVLKGIVVLFGFGCSVSERIWVLDIGLWIFG